MSDLTPEKSLLEVWSKSFPLLPSNRFNYWFTRSGLLAGLLPLALGRFPGFWATLSPIIELLVQVVGGLLGFIIAGYTIFASTSNPNFLVGMANFTPTGAKLPLIKLHLLNFLRLFLYTFLSLGILLFLASLGRLWPQFARAIQISDRLVVFGQCSVVSLVGFSATMVLSQVKSIIFNLYDLTLSQVRFLKAEAEKKDRLTVVPPSPENDSKSR